MKGGWEKFAILADKSLYLNNGARYGLLLITNRKSYTGF